MINNEDNNNVRRSTFWTALICGGICLFAILAALAWSGTNRTRKANETKQKAEVIVNDDLRPVTIAKTPTVEETKKQEETATKKEEAPVEVKKEPVFSYPLKGDIVMSYSVDSAIYDPTLNQYHTNDSISVSALKGAEVKAAERGTVKSITKDEEKGNTVSIQHEGGWLTTYSQLSDNISVKIGDSVEKGEKIGVVGEPSKYTVNLGSHLQFAITKDGKSVDPSDKLKEN